MRAKNDNNHGGKREGSGGERKWDGEETATVTFRLPLSVISRLDVAASEDKLNRAEAIVKLLDPALFERARRKKAVPVEVRGGREKVVVTEL